MADVSNKTLLVLVVLAVVISTLGTFTVVHSVNQHNSAASVPVDGSETTSGRVSIGINEPVKPDLTSGQVVLNINNDDTQQTN